MFLQGWVNGILINESSVYGTLCIVLLKILNMGLYFSEIDTRGWPYRRRDLLLPFNHSFALPFTQKLQTWSVSFLFTLNELVLSMLSLCKVLLHYHLSNEIYFQIFLL